MKRKIVLAIVGLLLGAAAYFPLRLLADDVKEAEVPSTLGLDANANYNDELWLATDFYQLNPTFSYAHLATGSKPSVAVYCSGSACVPADIVVTGWSVTGHMHFAAGS